jgi:hypothetical protein
MINVMRKLLSALAIGALLTSAAAAQTLTWRFDTDGDLEGWTPANFESVEVTGGMLRGVTQFDCQLLSPLLNINAADWTALEFRVSSSLGGGGEIFFAGEDGRLADDRKTRHVINASAEPQIIRVNLGASEYWTGVISRIRLDILNPAGAAIALDHISFLRGDPGVAPNPSFEHDFDGDGMPDYWAVSAATSEWSAEHATDGNRALIIGASQNQREAQAVARVPLDQLGVFALDATVAHFEGCGPGAIRATLSFYDVFGDSLPDEPATIPAAVDEGGTLHIAGEFVAPPLAASADLALCVTGKSARVGFDQVRVTHVRELPDPNERPLNTWRAHWIWAAESVGNDETTCHLRYAFDLPGKLDQIVDARCQLTADDAYELFVNGEPVAEAEDMDGWRTPEVVDLLPHLVAGRNVIAIAALDHTSAEGFLFEGVVSTRRRELHILSDASWKAIGPDAPGDWARLEFDDSAWPAAQLIAPAGADPWGYLPYEFMGRGEVVKLINADLPVEIAAGDTLTVSAILDHLPATASSNPIRLNLSRDGQDILRSAHEVRGNHTTTEEGEALGPLSLRTSRFIEPGEYQVSLGFPRTSYEGRDGVVIGSVRLRPSTVPEYPPVVEVRHYNGLPTLFINNHPNPFMHYIELRNSPVRIGNMRDAGTHIFQMDARQIGWQGPDQFDYTEWDARVVELLSYDPDAWIIPSFTFDGRHQRWWVDDHPEELCVNAEGSTSVGIYHSAGTITSLASQLWRDESGEALRKFVLHCRSMPYSTRVIGYHPASGVSWEWQHWGSVGDFPPTDYSEPMRNEFEQWTRREYADDIEAVRAAWRMPELTFATVAIPPVPVRDGADHMLFRVPADNRYVIDFYRFYQDVMVDGILHYFGIIKDVTHGEAIVGTYYGYTLTMLGGARRAGDSGHYALHRLLESDLCDFLVSPFDYSNRAVGETYQIMSAVGSVLAHDKLWVMQADLRTHLVTRPEQRVHGAPDGLAGTRAFASCAAKGLACQWYDFSNGWIARDPRQSQIIGRLRDIADRWLEWDRTPDPRGIAFIVDEDTPACYLSHEIQAMYWLVYRQKEVFERVGAPWNVYLLDDLVEGRVPEARCYFFVNTFHMTDAARSYINANLKSDGRTLVWMYAPGYIGADDLDVARIGELTGMEMTEVEEMRPWRLDPSEDHRFTAGLTAADIVQPNIEIGPVFHPSEDGIEVAGTWEGSDLPALAVRRFADWTSVYSATPLLSPKLVKRIAEDAGVAVRVAGVEPSYVSRNMIGLHSAVERTETLRFDEPMRVVDLLTGEILAADATELEVTVPGPGTRLLHTYPAQ